MFFLKRVSLSKLLLLALLFRLLLAPLAHHTDAVDILNWGKNLENFGLEGFYLRDTADAGDPNYPPGFYYLLRANQSFYGLVRIVLWKVNVLIPVFPSNFYVWFESDLGRIFFNKLLAIFFDLGIAYLIYKIVIQIKTKKAALISSAFFLFSPPIWYNSAVWGQTESLFALPLLASFYVLHKRKTIIAPVLFLISLLIKPTGILVLPIFVGWWILRVNKKDFFKGLFLSFVIFYFVHVPFNSQDTLAWIGRFYIYDVREVLGYLVANAFNFWGLLFGFEPRLDSILIFKLPAYFWGLGIFMFFIVYLWRRFSRKLRFEFYFLVAVILSFAGFLFLARMHERYFYITLLMLAPLVSLDKKLMKIFVVLSIIHLINLYHFWWVPRIEILVKFFSIEMVEKFLILVNITVFFWILKLLNRDYVEGRERKGQ